MPFFSVIIPLYNKANYINATLESVLSQTFTDYEIIIVNDGSTDNSLQIANSFKSDRIRIIEQENQGVAVARNNGIDQANGEYIALIDADDFWYDNHLFELKKQIIKYPDAKLYCNNYEIYHSQSTKRKAVFNFEYGKDCLLVTNYFEASSINSVAWTSAVSFFKKDFTLIGGFNPNLETCEDLDLWIRFALTGKVAFNPAITMSYKVYIPNSLINTENNTLREKFINSYSEEEKINQSLKYYLDVNRYAIAVRSKLLREYDIYKKTKARISPANLNLKQLFILNSPRFLIIILKRFHQFLIKKNIYLSPFK